MNRKSRYLLGFFVLLAVLLLAVHLLLPIVVKDVLNKKMADMGDYRGHVEDVDIVLWRGAYRMEGLNIVKVDGNTQAPFLKLPETNVKIRLRPFWSNGVLVAEMEVNQPELNFVDGDSEEQKQSGTGVDWREKVQSILPVRLDRVDINQGVVAFRNFNSEPPVNLYINELDLTVLNLTNAKQQEGARDATAEGTALFLGQAPIEASASFDPLVRMENLDLRLRMTDLELPRLNEFASAYGKFDFKAGTGDLVIEAKVRDSQLTGYVKPLLRNVDVFDLDQDVRNEDKGFFRGLWEAVVGGGQQVLQNQKLDQFATRVELSGSIDQADVSPLQAFFGILRNAFVEAFTTRFEQVQDDR
ncbi:DUF748 domain-containing protein [Halopseudomonas sabulinigri]|uniref:DUF748 domain-containing protein n=1 Tax=Halopseudomonas sabulinigri TaxID=472181 RepID=A0A1H1MTK3_9GAMM|nr:DUF748 domain-containing protein [Halopseudomonas sabulinigri]SDR90007.1 protein of unknown function [Halopseudomonas sabulinigri]